MNFKILKYLIFRIKQSVKCANCNKKLSDKDIFIQNANSQQAKVECNCSRCLHKFSIDAKLHKFRPHQNMDSDPIDKIEVNKMKEFLNDFNGDFKSIFKK